MVWVCEVLSERGVTRAARGDSPDIIVVNTCSVTETADKKGRQLIRRLAARYPEATMVVTGCYAQLKPEEVAALEGVDIVLGSNDFVKAFDEIEKSLACIFPEITYIDTGYHNFFSTLVGRGASHFSKL